MNVSMKIPSPIVCACLLFFGAPPGLFAEGDTFVETKPRPELIDELRQGGFVLYMRHGRTDSSIPDQVPIDIDDCGTQRPLTDEGREEIRRIGEWMRKAGIPCQEVFCSPLCRARESARLAFSEIYRVEDKLMYTAHLTSTEKIPVVAKTRELISRPVEPGRNRILVAHAPNLADLMGYFPETEGTVAVFRPLGDGRFQYLASILPGHWEHLVP